jgi:hypothetical protein
MKKILVLGAFVILTSVGLSGCTDIGTSSSKVELVKQWVDVVNSFVTDYKGTIKNIADYMITVKVIARFYDKNDTFLFSRATTISNIASTYTEDFRIRVTGDDKYKDNIDHVKYEFQVS